MPRYFFDVADGHRLIRVAVLAVSLDKPEDDPERRIAIINDQGREIGSVLVYSKPSLEVTGMLPIGHQARKSRRWVESATALATVSGNP